MTLRCPTDHLSKRYRTGVDTILAKLGELTRKLRVEMGKKMENFLCSKHLSMIQYDQIVTQSICKVLTPFINLFVSSNYHFG